MKTTPFRIYENDTIKVFLAAGNQFASFADSGYTRVSDVISDSVRKLVYNPDHYTLTITNMTRNTCKIIEK